MQIGEVAKRSSLTVDAIRFYEKRKLLPKADRSAGRFRLYGEGTIERLHFIQQMQGLRLLIARGRGIDPASRAEGGCLRIGKRVAESKTDRHPSEAARATASGVGA